MKPSTHHLTSVALALAALALTTGTHAGERVGVYDSRLVAYAHFFQPAQQAQLRQLISGAKAARAAGDTARYHELEKEIADGQRRMHLQVFSTAPIPETMAQLSARLPEIERATGVTRLVSKWDENALRGVAAGDRVDVTDHLVRDCELSNQQRQTMRELAGKEPLPLAKAQALAAKGKL